MQRLATLASVMALASMTALPSLAQTLPLVDPQISIEQSGGVAQGGDPNPITNTTSFQVDVQGGQGGQTALSNPLLIGIAVRNGQDIPNVTFTGCSGAGNTCALAPVGTYGITGNGAGGTLTMNSGTVYDAVGFSESGGSYSFGNMNTAVETKLGLTAATEYTIYLFDLPTNLTSGTPINIGDTNGMEGDFIFGLSCDDGDASPNGCINPNNGKLDNGADGSTPFTNAGLIDIEHRDIPEPSSLLIYGISLLGLAGMIRGARDGIYRLYRDA